jgi:diaminohydroxyphosphoribosylaminopyrimidine deaminase / 5-amino-6-(5-phosphoribosylamino)uracil reductase
MTDFSKSDEKFMLQALKLARRGIGDVEPNPPVGCVIVKAGKVIGRGWHRKYGQPHAEINAMADCRRKGHDPKGSTMYVSLEPCAHYGKTPPCTDALILARPARIVIATLDPVKHGKQTGAAILRKASIKVDVGLCQADGKKVILPFTKFMTKKSPWVILKWAQTIDGKLAHVPGRATERQWISNELSRADVHILRRQVQAIAVSAATIAVDDPLLTPRPSKGKKPLRVVIDRRLMIPLDSKVLNTLSDGPVMVITTREAMEHHPRKVDAILKHGADVVAVQSKAGRCDLNAAMAILAKRGIEKVLVEPGPHLAGAFLAEGAADEVRIYIAPKILGGTGAADMGAVLSHLSTSLALNNVEIRQFGNDVRIRAFIAGK